MKTFSKINVLRVSIIIALVISLVFSFCTFEASCEEIRNSVFRLHILANSDSSEDQELKIKVRDELLTVAKEIFDGTADKDTAERLAEENLDLLRTTAQKTVYDNGYNYTVSVRIAETYFNTRQYGEKTFPAGDYDALVVSIGEGNGKNWWCVMFPPLCVSAASESVDTSDVLSPKCEKIVENGSKYVVKFWCVEKFHEIKNRFFK